ncbi:hypothetical protein [Pseudomonas alkylphenolica]|uniref:hypothetical protein n=1 Tax=Pseudomonas alkylphenolica TaxID=237609 RepID=UPI0012FDF906|nr:hypothetical protein [Pseudomonas alkylphenolica]
MYEDLDVYYFDSQVNHPDLKKFVMNLSATDYPGSFTGAPSVHRYTVFEGRGRWDFKNPYNFESATPPNIKLINEATKEGPFSVYLGDISDGTAHPVTGHLKDALIHLQTGSVFEKDKNNHEIQVRVIILLDPDHLQLVCLTRKLS